ncbi:Repressor ROX1 [Psilocybe cubensis]|uniref:Repressor ROX1 n=1 Tax=Psilocybe cubensis TaxID=181762 RepID=A0ACB8GK69_PSICU|nr:Repressor ROX1 [Psilocybe cubensis]KAH9476076.1 Repressor ROX1 [Psilocybe cubensis]
MEYNKRKSSLVVIEWKDATQSNNKGESQTKPPRRKKPANHIPRPQNAFILFRSECIRQKMIPKSVEKDYRNLSRICGKVWKQMSADEREPWFRMADQEKISHSIKYPNYKFQPIPRNVRVALLPSLKPGETIVDFDSDEPDLDEPRMDKPCIGNIYMDDTFMNDLYMHDTFMNDLYMHNTFMDDLSIDDTFMDELCDMGKLYMDNTFTEEPYTDEPCMSKVYIDGPCMGEVYLDETCVDESHIINEPCVCEPYTNKPCVGEPYIDEPYMGKSYTEDEFSAMDWIAVMEAASLQYVHNINFLWY